MQYLLLFLEGIITFISPCLLPMLPVYISFFAAGEADKRRVLANAAGFVLGFTIVFVILGAFAGTAGRLLIKYTVPVNIVTGLIVIVLGLNFAGIINIGFLNRSSGKTAKVKDLNFFSSLLFGIVFSVGWTPCVGAFLGSALMMASRQGGTLNGIVMLLVYSLGLGIPFIVSALIIDRLKDAFDFIKRNYRVINIASGILLIVVGVLMATGLMGRFLSLTVL
jgi:cytochrome c-type biogenesis protein